MRRSALEFHQEGKTPFEDDELLLTSPAFSIPLDQKFFVPLFSAVDKSPESNPFWLCLRRCARNSKTTDDGCQTSNFSSSSSITISAPCMIINNTKKNIVFEERLATDSLGILADIPAGRTSQWFFSPLIVDDLSSISSSIIVDLASRTSTSTRSAASILHCFTPIGNEEEFSPLICIQDSSDHSDSISKLTVHPLINIRNSSSGSLTIQIQSVTLDSHTFHLKYKSTTVHPDQNYASINISSSMVDSIEQLAIKLTTISLTSSVHIQLSIEEEVLAFPPISEIELVPHDRWLSGNVLSTLSWNYLSPSDHHQCLPTSLLLVNICVAIQIGVPTLWIDIQPSPIPPLTVINETPFQLAISHVYSCQSGSKTHFTPPICVETRPPCKLPLSPFPVLPYSLGTTQFSEVLTDQGIESCDQIRGLRLCAMSSGNDENESSIADDSPQLIKRLGDSVFGYWSPLIEIGKKERQSVFILVGSKQCGGSSSCSAFSREKTHEDTGGVLCIDIVYSPSRPFDVFDGAQFDLVTPLPTSCLIQCSFVSLTKDLLWRSIAAASSTPLSVLGDSKAKQKVMESLAERSRNLKQHFLEVSSSDLLTTLPSTYEINLNIPSILIDLHSPQLLTEHGHLLTKLKVLSRELAGTSI